MNPLEEPATTKSRGRPSQYNHKAVLASAMNLFWRNGYGGTSLSDIEAEVGINRSTLYASFNGKTGLYVAAVDEYINAMEELLVRPLIEGTQGLEDLVDFVESLSARLADPANPDGCLIVNAMGSGDPPESMDRYMANLRDGFHAGLARAVERGEIAAGGLDEKASSLLSSAIGLNVVSKAGGEPEELVRLCRGVASMIDEWRQPVPA